MIVARQKQKTVTHITVKYGEIVSQDVGCSISLLLRQLQLSGSLATMLENIFLAQVILENNVTWIAPQLWN